MHLRQMNAKEINSKGAKIAMLMEFKPNGEVVITRHEEGLYD